MSILCIIVNGPGIDPQNRSHWAFGLHKLGQTTGQILDVSILDLERLIFQFELRKDVDIFTRDSEGCFEIAHLSSEQARQAVKIISEEPAPKDGVERCQDWVLRAVISLEAEEIVAAGTALWVSGLVGKAAGEVARAAGEKWISADGSVEDKV